MANSGVSPSPTDSDIDRLATELKVLATRSAWDRALSVGRIVFDGIAGGDRDRWFSRYGGKGPSLRRLAQHPACPFQKSALANAVNVHLFVEANPRTIHMSGIGPTHVAVVATLDSAEALRLLSAASANEWSVRELASRTRTQRRLAGEKRGRPPLPAARKAEAMVGGALRVLRKVQTHLSHCSSREADPDGSIAALLDEVLRVAGELRATLPVASCKPGLVVSLSRQAHPTNRMDGVAKKAGGNGAGRRPSLPKETGSIVAR